jgi:hypothetical protein
VENEQFVYVTYMRTTPEKLWQGVTYSLEPRGTSVKLTILHEMDKPGSKLLQSVSRGWPLVLASLKSLLETGEPLEATRRYIACQGKQLGADPSL